MNLTLVRHGEAVPVGGGVPGDADRPLTPRGEEDARLLGRFLARTGGGISALLSSPLLRARQTAELIRAALPGAPAVLVTENLAPGFRSRALYDEVARFGDAGNVVCVGHQPDMGNFLAYLIDVPAHGAVAMPTGAAARVVAGEGNPPAEAQLEWVVTPALLRGFGM
jgi:phosphohistidine phosphatase